MKKQFLQFLARVLANAAGIYVASLMLHQLTYQDSLRTLLVAAFVLALINAVIKPIVVIFSLPAYLITLGLFSIVVNAFMIYLVDLLYKPFELGSLGTAVLAGIIIGLVNYIVTRLFDLITPEEEAHG